MAETFSVKAILSASDKGFSAAAASPPNPFTNFVVFLVPTASSWANVDAISDEL